MPLTITVFTSINVLVVGDGIIRFGGIDSSEATFTLNFFLDTLRAHPAPQINVTTAHREGDPNADITAPFVFTKAILAGFDEVWLFGYDGSNGGFINGSPISQDEIAAIASFMDERGGVFATGDHAGLGSYMAGLVPRVRSMRLWFDAGSAPPNYPPNWPGNGASRIDTTRPDHLDQYFFDNQSDDIPQPLTLVNGTHPILQGPNGPINRFPDHMHEGEVITPWTTTDVLKYAGQSFIEYPTVAGQQELPALIATGTVLSHETPLEGNDSQQFQGGFPSSNAKTFGVLCAYDGRKASVGRVVTDSSFHHYLDLNLTGDLLGVDYKQVGFNTPAGAPVLAGLRAFYVNTALWLARSLHFWIIIDYVLELPWWWELFDPGGPVEENPLQILAYGELVRENASRYIRDGITVGWVNEALAEQGFAAVPLVKTSEHHRNDATHRYADQIVAAVLGGAMLELMRARKSPANRLSRSEAERAAFKGAAIGMRALGRLVREQAQQSTQLAGKLEAFGRHEFAATETRERVSRA